MEGFSGMGFLGEELEVAAILVELRNPGGTYCGSRFLPPSWGCKRRRSVEDATPSPQRLLTTSPPPPPPPPRVSVSSVAIWAAGPTGRIAAEKDAASSPATPLCFAPSDSSDEKPKPKRQRVKSKASKQKLEEELDKLTRCNVIYSTKKKEMEMVLQQLRADKILLTVRKIELSKVGNLVLDASSRQLETVKTLQNVDSGGDHLKPGIVDRYPPLIGDHRRATETRMIRGVPCPCPRYPITIGEMVTVIKENVAGPPPIVPDLNVSPPPPPPADPSAPYCMEPASHLSLFDYDRNFIKARAAEARRRRIRIWRGKSSK